jgi:hypothetical protein
MAFSARANKCAMTACPRILTAILCPRHGSIPKLRRLDIVEIPRVQFSDEDDAFTHALLGLKELMRWTSCEALTPPLCSLVRGHSWMQIRSLSFAAELTENPFIASMSLRGYPFGTVASRRTRPLFARQDRNVII